MWQRGLLCGDQLTPLVTAAYLFVCTNLYMHNVVCSGLLAQIIPKANKIIIITIIIIIIIIIIINLCPEDVHAINASLNINLVMTA